MRLRLTHDPFCFTLSGRDDLFGAGFSCHSNFGIADAPVHFLISAREPERSLFVRLREYLCLPIEQFLSLAHFRRHGRAKLIHEV